MVTLKYLSSMLPQIKKITEKFNFLNILFEYFSLIMYNSTPSIDSLLSFHFFSFLVNNIIHTVFLIHDGFPLKIVYNIDIDIINYLIVALFYTINGLDFIHFIAIYTMKVFSKRKLLIVVVVFFSFFLFLFSFVFNIFLFTLKS